MSKAGIWAVVPSKGTVGAKQRLTPVMDAACRGAFAMAMLSDVLAVLAEVRALAGVIVVTTDPFAVRIAGSFGARTLIEESPRGLTMAISLASTRLCAESADGMIVLPGDIPLVTSNDVETLLQEHAAGPSFVIVPARDEQGSNAVLVAPPGHVPLRFGDDSFRPHLASARAHGIVPLVHRLPNIALDIDTPRDLSAFLHRPSRTRARAFLEARGVTPHPLVEWHYETHRT
ncbi:MAG: 2-phospho-L-lactate guanylyltransferase [Methylobacteriaceae bacterium]|nr:2-phospho-L-lactate guanylyltransferase [Methylobacteriaceae bacterium]